MRRRRHARRGDDAAAWGSRSLTWAGQHHHEHSSRSYHQRPLDALYKYRCRSHSLARSLTHSLTPSLTHSLARSLSVPLVACRSRYPPRFVQRSAPSSSRTHADSVFQRARPLARARVRVLVLVLRARVYRDGDLPDHRQGEGLRRVLQHLQGARQLDHGAAAAEVRLREEPRRVRRRVEVEGCAPARRSGRPVGRCARGTCR